MSRSTVFVVGIGVLSLLVACIAARLPREYCTDLRPSRPTTAMVWTVCVLHLLLVTLAAVWSTWHFSLHTAVSVGGGVALIAGGAALQLSATWVFGFRRQAGTDTSRLVTEGIYGWSRNPLLLGWMLFFLGVGLIRGSGMVLLLTLLLALTYGLCLPLEERLLGRLYGEAYETYRRRTARFFGRSRTARMRA